MTGKLSANYVCNQVLKIVKESNLNYLVNETPYSAYVTIRKRFVKHSAEVTLADKDVNQENLAQENAPQDKLEALVVENNSLKEKPIMLETENKNMNIRLEIAKGQLSNKNDAFEKAVKDEENILERNKALTAELKQTKSILTNLKIGDKEKDDNLLMLELTLKNRELEIDNLKKELVTMNTSFPCEECDFSSITESDLKIHVENSHQHLCTFCSCSFAGKKKLKDHMCRIFVKNPIFERGLYMKDWFERDKCIQVFDDNTKKEVALLHTEDCVDKNICTNFPDDFNKTGSFKDTEGITNLKASSYIASKTVNWMSILVILKIHNL